MIPQQEQEVEVVGRLYNRMPPNMIYLESSSDRSSNGSTDTRISATQQRKKNFLLPTPTPVLLPGFVSENSSRDNDLTLMEIVTDAETSPKLSTRSKAKAKKVRLLFQQQQQRQEEELRELQQQAVAAIKKAAIREEILYYEKRNQSMKIQTQHVLERMELEDYSSSSNEYYNDIPYNDIDNDNHDNNNNNCFLTHLLPFFQQVKNKFDDQLLKSIP